VEIPSALAQQLHLLSHESDREDDFAAALTQVGTDLARVVPSLLAVSLTLGRLGSDVAVTALAPRAESSRVAASLAIPLTAGELRDALLLQAGDPGAFLVLAEDLAYAGGASHPPPELDRHLTWPTTSSWRSLESVLAELRVVNQAIGVLVDRGLTLDDAVGELERRASATVSTTGAVSRRLLANLPPLPLDPTAV
jgi:hypothetical protein